MADNDLERVSLAGIAAYIVEDLGLFLAAGPKVVSDDRSPNSNSLKLILASPSISYLLRMAINSYLVATCPIFLRNLFKFC